MNRFQEDSRITAYVMGELQGPDREQFEQELRESEELQQGVDAIRTLSRDLTSALRAEGATHALPPKALSSRHRSPLRYLIYLAVTMIALGVFGHAAKKPLQAVNDGVKKLLQAGLAN